MFLILPNSNPQGVENASIDKSSTYKGSGCYPISLSSSYCSLHSVVRAWALEFGCLGWHRDSVTSKLDEVQEEI